MNLAEKQRWLYNSPLGDGAHFYRIPLLKFETVAHLNYL